MFLRNAQAQRKNENKILTRQDFRHFFLVGLCCVLISRIEKATELASQALVGVTHQYILFIIYNRMNLLLIYLGVKWNFRSLVIPIAALLRAVKSRRNWICEGLWRLRS